MAAGTLRAQAVRQSDPFANYGKTADQYLNSPAFKGTKLTGKMLEVAARQTYANTGRVVPLDLALAQAQIETRFGHTAKSKNNIYNIGNTDAGDVVNFDSPQNNVNTYYHTIATNYLGKDKKVEDILKSFTDVNGNRYASDPLYEKKISSQMNYIRQHNYTHK